MLREVKNKHIRPRIVPFKITTAATPSGTVNIGYGDYTVTRGGTAGAGVLSLRTPFSRNGMLFGTQQSTTGGYFTLNGTAGYKGDFPYSMLANGGAATDGAATGFCFGWDSSDVSVCAKQLVKSPQSYPKIYWGKITGATGAVAIGKGDFSCVRTGTGVYNLGITCAFGQIPLVMVTGISAAAASTGKVTSVTASSFTVTMGTQAAAADQDFYVCAIGALSTSDAGNDYNPILNSQRFPRIVAFEITNTSGSWTCTIGSADIGATITDNGAGDFTVTLAEPFAREPAIFVTSTTQRGQVGSFTQATSTLRVQTRAAGGAATDTDGKTYVLCIGSQDQGEY